jgi:hypothetical protein
MKTSKTVSGTVRPQATVAMILGSPVQRLPQSMQSATQPPTSPTSSDKESMGFRDKIRRGYETPLQTDWDGCGLRE